MKTFLLIACLLLTGCAGTVTPPPVTSSQPSFDGSTQNSGFIGYAVDGRGIVTQHWRDRFNAMAAKYGKRFAVPPKSDEGLTQMLDGNWLVETSTHEKFILMNYWRKQEGGGPP